MIMTIIYLIFLHLVSWLCMLCFRIAQVCFGSRMDVSVTHCRHFRGVLFEELHNSTWVHRLDSSNLLFNRCHLLAKCEISLNILNVYVLKFQSQTAPLDGSANRESSKNKKILHMSVSEIVHMRDTSSQMVQLCTATLQLLIFANFDPIQIGTWGLSNVLLEGFFLLCELLAISYQVLQLHKTRSDLLTNRGERVKSVLKFWCRIPYGICNQIHGKRTKKLESGFQKKS